MPKSRTDAVALMHDVDYMIDGSAWESMKSDMKAIRDSDFSLEGLTMKAGLAYRSIFLRNWFYGGDPEEGEELKQIVKNDPGYRSVFKQFGLLKRLDEW